MRSIAQYRRQDLEGASNEDLLLRLLEKAIHHQLAADRAMEAGQRSVWLQSLHLARAIILELATAFDPSVAPEVAAPVLQTYRWILHHLVEAGRTGDRARLQTVRETTEALLRTWSEAIERGREAPWAAATS